MPKTMKPAAVLPRTVTVAFDDEKKQRLFEQSRTSLRNRMMTERELVIEALRLLPGMTAEALVREGSLRYAREVVRKVKSPGQRANPSRLGSADDRIAAAFKRLVAENRARARAGEKLRVISPGTVGVAAATNTATARRWLARYAPEHLS